MIVARYSNVLGWSSSQDYPWSSHRTKVREHGEHLTKIRECGHSKLDQLFCLHSRLPTVPYDSPGKTAMATQSDFRDDYLHNVRNSWMGYLDRTRAWNLDQRRIESTW